MRVLYEWQISDPVPLGTVSVVLRLTDAEAADLVAVDLSDPAQPDAVISQATQRMLIATLQRAVADGELVLPTGN